MSVVCASLGSRDLDRFGFNLKLLESECRYPRHRNTKYPKAALHNYIPTFDYITARTTDVINKEKNKVRRDALVMKKVIDQEIIITLGTGRLIDTLKLAWPGVALGTDRRFIRTIETLGKYVTSELFFYAWARHGIEYGLDINGFAGAQSMPIENYLEGLMLK